jgi:arsenite/tail-anchored protein-transporting ATPase
MMDLSSLRAVLVAGKGGVGKTTVTAGLARAAAAAGKRVLAAEVSYEIDSPTPLADILGLPHASEEPRPIADNLSLTLLTPHAGHLHFLRDALPMHILADAAMKSAAIRRFLLAAPSLAEMGVLYRILDLLRRKRSDGSFEYDLLIVDLPATGHALGLAQVPSAILKVVTRGPIHDAVHEGLKLLTDPKQTGALLVTLPETLPVSEAIELARGIGQHKIPLAGVIVNRVPNDPFTAEERAALDAMHIDTNAMLGARTIPRIDRAKESIARLQKELGHPPLTLPEVVDETHLERTVAQAFGIGPR